MIKKLWSWMKAHPYSYAMFYLVLYLIVFFTLEAVITPKYLIYSKLDDYIPFCEWFAVFYASWLLLFPCSLVFFLLYDKEDYQNLCFILMNGATLCFLCYIIWPTALDLRVEITNTNLLAETMKMIWAMDTPTNVCPSLHVSISTSIALVALKSKKLKKHFFIKWTIAIWMILICISTVFVKQHSIIDVFWGAVVTALFGVICYRTNWKKLVQKTVFRSML